MIRPLLIASVALAAYCILNALASAVVAMVWRGSVVAPLDLPPQTRARRLLMLRLLPALTAFVFTFLIVLPAFITYEPVRDREPVGTLLAALALIGAIQIAVGVVSAWRSARQTAQVEREWRRHASALNATAVPPTVIVESPMPLVALIGVFRPKLFTTRGVVSACNAAEFARIVAHERGHLAARDNLKRWVMSSLPDALRWTPVHRHIVEEWHEAGEDAADDAAVGQNPAERAALAALLLKIVRMASPPQMASAIVSPFIEEDGFERRVRRLLRDSLEPPAPPRPGRWVALAAAGTIVAAIATSPTALRTVFEAVEALVAFGR